jgi:hypothetical protein
MSATYGIGVYGAGLFGSESGGTLTAQVIMNARKPGSGDSARAAELLPLVPLYLSEAVFPALKWPLIQALLVLHWMQMEDMAGGASAVGSQTGAVTSESEGQLSRSYGSQGAVSRFGLEYLGTTMWGNELRGILRGLITTFGIANGGVTSFDAAGGMAW